MLFERVTSEGLAQYSYLVGDDQAGVCAVIDPRRDVAIYLELARQHNVRIAYILETHIHADFVSGSRELAVRTGAPIGVGAEAEVGYAHQPLHHGAAIELGELRLEALHTPGHSPEHVSYAISGGSNGEAPWGVFTGDCLFAGDVGRPDLVRELPKETLARDLYHSLQQVLLPLGDGVIVYPGHGEGSPCGARIGDRATTTMGYERQHNPALQAADEAAFVRHVLEGLPDPPAYYARVKTINQRGPAVLGGLPDLEPLASADCQRRLDEGALLLDTRDYLAFGGAHIAGALNIPLREAFPVWAGRLLDAERPLVLVIDDARALDQAQRHLLRIGVECVEGYLLPGMRGWIEGGYPVQALPQLSVRSLRQQIEAGADLQVVDVRSEDEWRSGHIPGAQHIYAADLAARLDELDRARAVAVYCGSGFRASIAASVLRQHGFEQVYNVPGSMAAWKALDYPLEEAQAAGLLRWIEW